MGSVRKWKFDAVIGIGGIGDEAEDNGIAGKINWIGIGPRPEGRRRRGPILSFDHFRNFGTNGPDFRAKAPKLSKRIYSFNIRRLMDNMTSEQQEEAERILNLAMRYPHSPGRKTLSPSLLIRSKNKTTC